VVDLAAVAAEAVAEAQATALMQLSDVGIAAGEMAPVCSDADGLRIMVRNLLDNAIKYTPRGGRIDLVTGMADGVAQLTVSDNGPGIPATDRRRVLTDFFVAAARM
jgi:two-component system OmpR family sensor kinase